MPVVGFEDSDGLKIPFEDVHAGIGSFLTRRGSEAPRAMVSALARGFRDPDHYGPDTVSVTTLVSPVQQTRLLERYNVYVRWDANLWAAYGTIAHGFFEAGVRDVDIAETRLRIVRDGVTIGGTFDLLEYVSDWGATAKSKAPMVKLYHGKDYKITSAYGVRGMCRAELESPGMGVYLEKPDYFWQANLYHWMTQQLDVEVWLPEQEVWESWALAGKVNVQGWDLVCISRDFNERSHGKEIGPVEVIPVRLIELERVERYLAERVLLYKASELCDDGGLPECTEEETWQGKRCAQYCDAAAHCLQVNPNLRLDVG